MAHAFCEEQTLKRGKIIERVAGKLDLTAEQRQRLGVLADKLQAQRAALVGTTTNPRAELQTLVASEKFDRTRARLLLTEKTTAITSKSPEVIAAIADFYDSLTPVQQTKVRETLFLDLARRRRSVAAAIARRLEARPATKLFGLNTSVI